MEILSIDDILFHGLPLDLAYMALWGNKVVVVCVW